MADKPQSDTLRQRRRAQQDLIELERLKEQAGSLPEHESYENEMRPKTARDKLSHFWYYYKVPFLAVLLVVCLIVFTVSECAAKAEPDLEIVVFDNRLIPTNYIESMTAYFEQTCPDYNGDGKVSVIVIDCTYQAGSSTAEYQQTKMQKLQSIIAADQKATVFITGRGTYDFLNSLAGGGLVGTPHDFPDEFYREIILDIEYPAPSNLCFSVRQIEGTLFAGKEEATTYKSRADDYAALLDVQ